MNCPKRCVFFLLFVFSSSTASRIFLIFCMSVEDNTAHLLSQMVYLKKHLIQDYREFIVVSKKGVFDFFVLFSTTALRNFLILCTSVEDIRAHCLIQMGFLKKLLIPDYGGFSVVSKECVSDFFVLFSTKALINFLIFCMSVEDIMAHCLSQMGFLKKFLNLRLWGG